MASIRLKFLVFAGLLLVSTTHAFQCVGMFSPAVLRPVSPIGVCSKFRAILRRPDRRSGLLSASSQMVVRDMISEGDGANFPKVCIHDQGRGAGHQRERKHVKLANQPNT